MKTEIVDFERAERRRKMRRETRTRHLGEKKKKRGRRKTNRAALAQERPRRIVKRRRGTRCEGEGEKGAIRFGNKHVREGRAGRRDGSDK